MADDTDFVALYDELGLDAECSMLEFKGAYRRRVAKLHPDHLGDPSTISRLQRLNRLYAAALEFQRIHGRLPGATHRISAFANRAEALEQATAQSHTSFIPPPVAGKPIDQRYILLLLLLAATAFWLGQQPKPEPARDKQMPVHELRQAAAPLRPVGYVHIGMNKDLVHEIQGQPLNSNEVRWEYGPSWVEFRCDKVVDWYSSPLRPLRVQHTDAGEDPGMAAARVGHC
ncbi:MAG: J domain-containing protein [Pseudoxanthomonas sp.]